MTRLLHIVLTAVFSLQMFASHNAVANITGQEFRIEINHNLDTDVITARLIPFRVGDEKEHFHRLDLSALYTYQGKNKQRDEVVNLELSSVVKTRKLNPDLYVVFIVDGREIHFPSNRSAVRNPIPGRFWVGERMVFSVPTEDFHKIAAAKELAIKMGSVRFDLDERALRALKVFGETIKKIAS